MLAIYKFPLCVKTIFLLLFLIIIGNIAIASGDGWRYVGIDSTCSFKIPPTMEVQSREYDNTSISIYKKMHPDKILLLPKSEKKIICQQKGLNELNEKSRKLYVRVIFEEEQSGNILPSLYDKIIITDNELNEIADLVKNQTLKQTENINMTLAPNVTSKLITINGMNCICVSYKRKIGNNPDAIVRIYIFFNKYVINRFTVSYRSTESHLWENDLETVISSLKIIKK